MNNQVGLGVFGTFGDPHGYQQAFYSDVKFNGSLDLDDNAIEFYPGAELFATSRELVNGVYTVCFCIYSYARELNTERFGTFIGSCIVLQDTYAEADYIYKALRSLHASVTGNTANIDNNTIRPEQAKDIVVLEPAEMLALKANAIPISKTPFFSTNVDAGKKYMVPPNPLSGDSEETQVIDFFDAALKHYSDSAALYFSFDRNVYEFVSKAGVINATDWDEFIEYLPQQSVAPAIVRTKKGIQKTLVDAEVEPHNEVITNTQYPEETYIDEEPQTYIPANDLNEDDDDEDDQYRPFDLWEEENTQTEWTPDEIKFRVKEYNRLFKYTNTLLVHMNEPTGKKKNKKVRTLSDPAPQEGSYKKKKRKKMLLLFLCLIVGGALAVYFLAPDNTGANIAATTGQSQSVTSATADGADTVTDASMAIDDTVNEVVTTARPTEDITPQPISKVPVEEPVEVKAEPAKPAQQPSVTVTGYLPEEKVPSSNPLMPRDASMYQKAGPLHPRPNIEMTQSDIAMLRESGVKNKTLAELTRILFDNVPSNIGNIYRGQDVEYAAALLAANKNVFQPSGNDFICSSDFTALHIPAYKSPRLPAVFPK